MIFLPIGAQCYSNSISKNMSSSHWRTFTRNENVDVELCFCNSHWCRNCKCSRATVCVKMIWSTWWWVAYKRHVPQYDTQRTHALTDCSMTNWIFLLFCVCSHMVFACHFVIMGELRWLVQVRWWPCALCFSVDQPSTENADSFPGSNLRNEEVTPSFHSFLISWSNKEL